MNYEDKVKDMVNSKQMKLLVKYVALIEEQNKVMNLTGFSGEVLWREGIYESIICLTKMFNNKPGKLLDIGAGAGFPSIPYLICNPHIDLTVYEPMKKKSSFLKLVKKELNLRFEIKIIRAEDSKEREQYNFITARAVMNFRSLAEISYHLGKQGSIFAFIKGPKTLAELADAKWISFQLSIKPLVTHINQIDYKDINIIHYKKNNKTPKGFPRPWSIIKKL